ncbi:hypothetical protein B566_EDAN013903 [Ephemera danica]|nr:hypothetical protein B566_EDAN013903 [Ephemera danica]
MYHCTNNMGQFYSKKSKQGLSKSSSLQIMAPVGVSSTSVDAASSTPRNIRRVRTVPSKLATTSNAKTAVAAIPPRIPIGSTRSLVLPVPATSTPRRPPRPVSTNTPTSVRKLAPRAPPTQPATQRLHGAVTTGDTRNLKKPAG